MRVVLIDDSDEVRKLIAELLTRAGHDVIAQADDGAAGVRVTLDARPDLVVTDWRMPAMDGIEVTSRIKAADPEIAVVALASLNDPILEQAFLEAGADAFIRKGDVAGLLAAVQAVEQTRSRPD